MAVLSSCSSYLSPLGKSLAYGEIVAPALDNFYNSLFMVSNKMQLSHIYSIGSKSFTAWILDEKT